MKQKLNYRYEKLIKMENELLNKINKQISFVNIYKKELEYVIENIEEDNEKVMQYIFSFSEILDHEVYKEFNGIDENSKEEEYLLFTKYIYDFMLEISKYREVLLNYLEKYY